LSQELSELAGEPPDACNSCVVAFKLLEQFEDDLHIHVHLENNILYPKVLNLAW
jgi:regulator of cell morphogenesis and NO signaling